MLKTNLAVVVLCLITAAIAAANPIAADIYIDFAPPNEVFTIDPVLYQSVNAFVVVGPYTSWLSASSVSFDLSLNPEIGHTSGEFTSSVPGAGVEGTMGSGITVSSADCLGEFPLVLGWIHIFYVGGSGYVRIHPHPDLGSVYSDCEDPVQEHDLCFVQDGGIHAYDVWPRDVCGTNPVIQSDWGAIKAMFRQ